MTLVFLDKVLPIQPPEDNYGNKEYKRYLIPKKDHEDFIARRGTQMLFRLMEGEGKALYLIGVDDDGVIRGLSQEELDISVQNFKKIARLIEAHIKVFRIYKGREGGYVVTVRIFLKPETYLLKLDSLASGI